MPDSDFVKQWDVVATFYAAAREGDFERLLEVLDPDVLLRIESGAGAPRSRVIRGARPVSLASFIVKRGRVVEIEMLSDPARLALL